MFYRKYRPQKFSECAQPDPLAEALMNQIKTGKTVHAYLFSGPRGTGKTTHARILAKALNCAKVDKNGDPCGTCEHCLAIQNGTFMDLIEIDAASNRGIDDIRDLREKVKLSPTVGKAKVYLIDEVHMLTTEAFNALLKTLEEPPKHAVFILCTTELNKVPDTIKSRCQVFKIKRAGIETIVNRLRQIAKDEKAKVSDEDLTKIAQVAYGGFRDADTLLQQVIEGNLTASSLVSVSSEVGSITFVEALVRKDKNTALKIINEAFSDGIDLNAWTTELILYLRNLLFIANGVTLAETVTEDGKQELDQATKLGYADIVNLINLFMAAQSKTLGTSVYQLPLEMVVLDYLGGGSEQANGTSFKPVHTSPVSPVHPPTVKPSASKNPNSQTPEKKEDTEDTETTADTELADDAETTPILISIDQVLAKWESIVKESVKINHSITALLKASRPFKTVGKYIVLEVMYSFHKERLENPKNRQLVEQIVQDILQVPVGIQCEVNEASRPVKVQSSRESGVLTDFNVAVPSGDLKGSLLQVFDGALPMV